LFIEKYFQFMKFYKISSNYFNNYYGHLITTSSSTIIVISLPSWQQPSSFPYRPPFFFHHLITVIIISITIIKKYFTYKKIFFKLNIMDVKYFMQNKHTRTSHTKIKSGIETMFLVYKNLKLTRLMRKMLRKNSL
jgi:hypothetical protein